MRLFKWLFNIISNIKQRFAVLYFEYYVKIASVVRGKKNLIGGGAIHQSPLHKLQVMGLTKSRKRKIHISLSHRISKALKKLVFHFGIPHSRISIFSIGEPSDYSYLCSRIDKLTRLGYQVRLKLLW